MNEESEQDPLHAQLEKQRSQNEQNNSYMQDEENSRDRVSNQQPHCSKTNNIFNFGNRKRREIKMEREQLTNLFAELIMLVNQRVAELDTGSDRPKLQPVPLLKNKPKSTKQKKQQSPRLPSYGKSPQDPIISRKISMKQDRNHNKQQQERERLKREVLANYESLMNYKIHAEDEQNGQQMLQEHMESNFNDSNCRENSAKGKQFGVFQSVSLMINPVSNNC